MRLKLAAIVVLLVVGGAAVAVSLGVLAPPATNATSLLTAPATVTDVSDEIAATGTVQATSQYALAFGAAPVESAGSSASDASAASNQLAASIDWPVTSVKVAAGDHVTAGQVLATAGTADLESQITDAKRAVGSAAIKVDQRATVTVSALDASLRGHVASIDPVGSASGSSGVVSFAVIVKLDSPPTGLRPGMSADITIVAASATNVLAIPSRALSGS